MNSKIGWALPVSLLLAASIGTISGCSTTPKAALNQSEAVKVFGPDQIFPAQYDHVRYLWVDSWRTAFWLPSASNEAEGVASLQTEAARLGANGLVNVICIDQGQGFLASSRSSSVLCYGHAIRVR